MKTKAQSSNDPALNLVADLLKDNDGVAIGEFHYDQEAPLFLAKNMKKFADAGVTHIFVEMFEHMDNDMLQHFQKTGELEKEFPANRTRFERCLDWELNRWANGRGSPELKLAYIDLLKAARENNIKIVGIDDISTIGRDRLELSNPIWSKAINENKPEHGKYLVHGGIYHFSKLLGEVEPVSKRLGIPSVGFTTENASPEISIVKNTENSKDTDYKVIVEKGYYKNQNLEVGGDPKKWTSRVEMPLGKSCSTHSL